MQVESPKGAYSGQKLITLVSKKIPPRITSISPIVPGTIPVKYSMPNTAARINLTIRSVDPMFFFIPVNLRN